MSYTDYKRIFLKGLGRHEEAIAGGAVTPGDYVEINATGQMVVHATDGASGERLFATEPVLNAGGTVDTAYATNDHGYYVIALPGDEIWARLAGNANYTAGAKLTSAGDGTLKAAGAEDAVVAILQEAIDLTGEDASRAVVRVL